MRKFGWLVAGALLLAAGGLVGCVSTRLPNVSLTLSAPEAAPPVLGPFQNDPPIATAAEWTARRAPLLRTAFLNEIYGAWPAPAAVSVAERTVLAEGAFQGAGDLEQWRIAVGPPAEGRGFSLLLVLPRDRAGPVPIVLMQNFCGNKVVYPKIAGIDAPRTGGPPECGNAFLRPVIEGIFGSYIITPPTEEVLAAGYGLAMYYAADLAADDKETAMPALTGMTPPEAAPTARTGAVAAWAWSYLLALEALAEDPRIAADRIVLWGHSRNGKSALLAAAMDPRPAAVVALQPGTAGGSLGRDEVGESIAQITDTYPHWFAPGYAAYAGRQRELPVDQHQLLALIAPRPVLLGGARRDQWSDPHGALRAAEGAAPVYALFGAPPFTQTDLTKPDFAHPLVTYMRPGLHGVQSADWGATLSFLGAHKSGRPPQQSDIR